MQEALARRTISLQARALGLVAVLGLALAMGAECAASCPLQGSETVTVVGIGERLEVQLADGRRLRLVGLDPVLGTPNEPEREEQARRDLAARMVGRALDVAVLAREPDRWGRLPAYAFSSGNPPGGAAAAVLALGWGRYLPEPTASACRSQLLAAEEEARTARLGLWADPYYAVLAVDDRAAFAERTGTFVVAEGRLASVTMSPYRTKLVFQGETPGSRGGQLLSATISLRVAKIFEARGLQLETMIGWRLRLRGLLDLRFGPQIELAGPDSLDVIDTEGSQTQVTQPEPRAR